MVTIYRYILPYTLTEILGSRALSSNVSKGAKIRNRYNQVPHLTQDTNGEVTNSQLYTTNKSQEVSPPTPGDHKAQINRRPQRQNKHKTEKKKIQKRSTALERPVNTPPEGLNRLHSANPTLNPGADQDTQTSGPNERPPTHPTHHLLEHTNQV